MADTTISGLSRILSTNTGAIIPISVDGITSGLPVSGVITATGDIGGGLPIPVGTTAQRPASPRSGMLRYNTSTSALEIYTGTGWFPLAFNNSGGNTPIFTPTKITYDFTGSDVNFTVPTGVTSLSIKLWGGAGSSVGANAPGGGGGFTGGTLAVTPGQSLIISVGGGASSTHAGGYNGGGNVGGSDYSATYGSGGGGGYSGIFTTSKTFNNAIIIAGGGGGGGYDMGMGSDSSMAGGPGGGITGGDSYSPTWGASGGKGGTQSAGGVAGQGATGVYVGSQLQGGLGQVSGGYGPGGGGGGGYYGGGGGYGYYRTVASGGGGGGSGYYNSSLITSVSILQGDSSLLKTGNPANFTDTDRGTAGQGGKGTNAAGSSGRIVISYYPQ